MDFKKINLATGWLVFLVATYTYVATIEPTGSFWDCGEFLATANKLQVGHPPGAPLFMIMGRVASAFVSTENVPVAINTLSALCSSFTILFLFWSITHMARKLALRDLKDGEELSTGRLIAVMASGLVGALAYTWSDSFWFSAVEAEVYSMSSLFTAVTFWCILKWENEADKPHNARWLILICYLLGLSIGVQLLGLLCIPAIALVYYFKKYDTTARGVIWVMAISAVILGTIQAIIIPGVAKVAGWFELVFVNDMGLPFNTGNLVYGVLLLALIVWGLVWTQRTGRTIANTIILGVSVILLGYSTYAMTVIRSLANPPIDENNPENVFNLVSYLNREQYGDRPLLVGQFWDSPHSDDEDEWGDGSPVYTAAWLVKKGNKTVKTLYDGWSAEHFVAGKPDLTIEHAYQMTDDRKNSVVAYEKGSTMVFPRMHSSQASHIEAYKEWSDFKGELLRDARGRPVLNRDKKPIYKPTQSENMRFFVSYQVNWMYWRYFLWNFAGRQNDIQGHGTITDGNWYSGIKAIDEQRLGNQENLPSSMTDNKGMNKLYLLPLLLGVIGFVYQLTRHLKDWSIVMLLFFFTGIAIVIYLNQSPYQPRERDYAYVGSFYAFAMWIGFGVYALFDAARGIGRKEIGYAVAGAAGLGVLRFLMENFSGDDHSISYMIFIMAGMGGAALALMRFVLGGVKNDAVVAATATALGMAVPVVMVRAEWDDHDRSTRKPARDLAADYLNSCAPNAILFTNGDNDTFPLWYAQEVEGIRTDVRVVNLSLLNTDWYIDQQRRKAYESDPIPMGMPPEKYRQGTRDVVALIPDPKNGEAFMDLKNEMAFSLNDRNMRNLFSMKKKDAWMRTDRFSIPVDREKVLANGTVSMKDSALIRPAMQWKVGKSVVLKNHYAVLDLLANFNWDRPIYFAVTTGPDSYIGMGNWFQLEGLTYRIVPVQTQSRVPNMQGRVGTDVMYRNVMEKFVWGNMDTEEAMYLDENVLRMTTNLRLQMANLADALIKEGRKDDAVKVLDLSCEKMPERNVPYDRVLLPTIEAYYKAGETEKADAINKRLFELLEENMAWYMSLDPKHAEKIADEMGITHAVLERMLQDATENKSPLADDLRKRFEAVDQAYEDKITELENNVRRVTRTRF